jgi:DNA-directed RNA polymerase specialized sigma subunit
MKKVEKLLHWWANKYNVYGYDHDDMMQELRIVQINAERNWKPDGTAGYVAYLTTCVRRHVAALIRASAKSLNNPLCPPPADGYKSEPSFIMQEARKLFESVKHEKTRRLLLQALDMSEAGVDVHPCGRVDPLAESLGLSRGRVHQILQDVRKTPAFRKFREELYAA